MKLLVCGGAGFIGSNFVRQRVAEQGDAGESIEAYYKVNDWVRQHGANHA